MLTVTLILSFVALCVLIVSVQIQVNQFVKSTYELIQKVENHIYL